LSAQCHFVCHPCSRAVKRNKDDNNDNFMTSISHLQVEHCISAAKSSIEWAAGLTLLPELCKGGDIYYLTPSSLDSPPCRPGDCLPAALCASLARNAAAGARTSITHQRALAERE
jgi:hypothetical protein